MSAPLLGRIVGEKIELDAPVEGLEGMRVRVTLELIETEEHPVARAIREASLDDRPMTSDERASIDESKRDGRTVTSAEIRAKLIARDRSGG